ncbi:hypothetical protein [Micromonospora sp. S-DT3-3-22]|uniref:hypothetical protein n=1 Tax=Micromonospora sp. S-DT3-3-22 TaxID=2755359 RepID=UPI0018905863|nr:hypothetical protein [Micromonospora sp. S-DT3-3-22]
MESINPGPPAGLVAPLRTAGQLRVVDGDAPLTPGVRPLPTRGTPPATSPCWSTPATAASCSPATCWCT